MIGVLLKCVVVANVVKFSAKRSVRSTKYNSTLWCIFRACRCYRSTFRTKWFRFECACRYGWRSVSAAGRQNRPARTTHFFGAIQTFKVYRDMNLIEILVCSREKTKKKKKKTKEGVGVNLRSGKKSFGVAITLWSGYFGEADVSEVVVNLVIFDIWS